MASFAQEGFPVDFQDDLVAQIVLAKLLLGRRSFLHVRHHHQLARPMLRADGGGGLLEREARGTLPIKEYNLTLVAQ